MAFLAAAIVLVGCLFVAALWDLGRRFVATKRTPALMELREELIGKIECCADHDEIAGLNEAFSNMTEHFQKRTEAAERAAEDAAEELRQARLRGLGGKR